MANFGGNRFGGSSGGGNSLHRRQVELMLESALRKKNSGGRNIQGGGGPMQPQPGTYGNPMMMSSSPASAAETNAHTLKRKHSAEYGDRWNQHMKHSRSGLENKRIGAQQQKDVAAAMKEAEKFKLEKRKFGETQRHNKATEAAKAGLGLGAPGVVAQTGRPTTGAQYAPAVPIAPPQVQAAQPQTGYATATDANGNVIRVDDNGMTRIPAVGDAPVQPPAVISPGQAAVAASQKSAASHAPLKYRKPKYQGPASTNNLNRLGEYLKKVIGRTPM